MLRPQVFMGALLIMGAWFPALTKAHAAHIEETASPQADSKSDQQKQDDNSNKPVLQLTGKVVDRAGKPIANADVTLQGPTTTTRRTGSDGAYSFSVPAGKYTVRAAKSGNNSDPITVNATKNSEIGDLVINIEK